MSAPLDRALAALPRHVPEARPEDVVRVEAKDDGALVLEVTPPGRHGSRWLRAEPEEPAVLRELRPREDPALPLVRAWEPLEREGRLEVLAWRPGRRIVLRHEAAGVPVIRKGYRRRRSAAAYEAALVAQASARLSSFRVPAVRDHEPELECLVFEHVAGRPADLGPGSAETFGRVGAALRAFQNADAAHFDRAHDAEAELRVLDRAAERVRRATGALPAGWERERTSLEAGSVPSGAPPVLAHRDLHDGQLLVDRGAPAPGLLDFDLLARADDALDAANLLAHLELRRLQRIRGATAGSVRAAGEALLAGLGRDGQPGFAERLRFYLAATFLRLALVYALRPRWIPLTPELTRRAAHPLDVLPT